MGFLTPTAKPEPNLGIQRAMACLARGALRKGGFDGNAFEAHRSEHALVHFSDELDGVIPAIGFGLEHLVGCARRAELQGPFQSTALSGAAYTTNIMSHTINASPPILMPSIQSVPRPKAKRAGLVPLPGQALGKHPR